MGKKMFFVYNPRSGKEMIKGKLADILDVFTKGGYEITIRPTQRPGEALELVRDRSEEYDLVVCSGGDGTLDEVVTGMMQSSFRTPIGYIPAGSTNDFGGSLNLPKNMVQAAEIIVNGENFACDVGTFNEDVFVYIAAFGLFTEVSYETNQDMKNVLGHMAYVLEGMRSLSNIQHYSLKITCGDRVIEDDFIFGMITNSVSVGGFKNVTGKNVDLADGMFEVTLIKRPWTPAELNELSIALLNRDIDNDAIYCFPAEEITIECKDELAWTLDGEFGGKHKKVTIKNLSRAIEVRV